GHRSIRTSGKQRSCWCRVGCRRPRQPNRSAWGGPRSTGNSRGTRVREPDALAIRGEVPMATDRRDDVTAVPFNLRADAYAGTADAYVRFRVPYPPDLPNVAAGAARPSGAGRLPALGSGPAATALPLA